MDLLINIQDLQFLKHHNEIKLKILVFDNQTWEYKARTQEALVVELMQMIWNMDIIRLT